MNNNLSTAIITVTQGDFLYIDEWISYHHNIGVDLFLIAYNGNYKDFDKLPKYDYVRYFDISTNNSIIGNKFNAKNSDEWCSLWSITVNMLLQQIKQYFSKFIKYVAIIDTDEFISTTEKINNITEYLDSLFNNEICKHICMQFYNDNEQIYYENKPVLERFTNAVNNKILSEDDVWDKKQIINIQHPDINSLYVRFFHSNNILNDIPNILDFNKIILKHFVCKSLEEWIMKFNIKYDRDYINRFKGKIFNNYFYNGSINNNISEEKIKAIPELLKKYEINYKPEIDEEDEEFKNLYKRYNNLNSINMNNIIIYCIYHDNSLIERYNLSNIPNYIKLFNVNNDSLDNIHQLNLCLNELVAYYYIWKNQIKSKYVGFCHYRRFFKNIGLDNLEKYGVHYYGFIQRKISHYRNNGLYDNNNSINKLYKYLCDTNKFNKDDLYEYFYNDKIINLPLKDSFIFSWDKFNEICELIFGFLEYLYPNYKEESFINNNKNRSISYRFELYLGIIVALTFNNIKLENTNWNIFSDRCLLTYSNNIESIIKWTEKNNRTCVSMYIISNSLTNEQLNFDDMVKIITNKNEIIENDIIELNINEYINCLDYESFINNEYEIINDNNKNNLTLKIWVTYHNKNIPKEYNLFNTNLYKLFNDDDKTLKKDNINYLHDYLGEMTTYYYVWKNQIKSNYVGFCQYRRHFINIDYDELNKNGIYAYHNCTHPNSLYDKIKYIINDFILIDFINYMYYKYNIDIYDYIFNKEFAKIGYHNMYIFRWDIFNEVCDFIFGFYDYITCNNWNNENSIIHLAQYYHLQSIENYKNQNIFTIDWYWKRGWSVINEFLIGIFINIKYNVKIHSLLEDEKYYISLDTNNKIDKEMFNKWYKLNAKTGIITFLVNNDIINLFNEEELNKKPYKLITEKLDHLTEIKLKINEYIDCEGSIEFNKGKYKIKCF